MESSPVTPSPALPLPPPSPSLPPSQDHSQWQGSLLTLPTPVQWWPLTVRALGLMQTDRSLHWKTVRRKQSASYTKATVLSRCTDSYFQLRLGGATTCSDLVVSTCMNTIATTMHAYNSPYVYASGLIH